MIGENTLISKDSKGKIRVVEISYQWEDEYKGFVIRRKTYQYGGKITPQPEIVITKGKVKRTVTEQATLEYNSHIKKYQDKGYKLLEKNINKYSKEDLDKILPEHTTDANGFQKHMLAKQADKVATSTFDRVKYWYGSRKIDGVRASFYFKDGEVKTASRGGGDYDPSTKYLRENPKLIEFFNNHPTWILDGELYKAGKSLQAISGAARLEKDTKGMDWLEYYIYDVMIPDTPFEERLEILETIKEELDLGFEPEREWKEDELRFQIVPQEKVSGWNSIKELHDKYVAEGWEGIVIRDPNKNYKFGGRGSEMIKVKNYLDNTFKVIDYELGLRGSEDMVFICELEDGRTFKAMPIGNREIKEEYIQNFENKYKNQKGDCKYFYYSDDGIPLQPKFKCFRYDV